jgi:hypothetical protein
MIMEKVKNIAVMVSVPTALGFLNWGFFYIIFLVAAV